MEKIIVLGTGWAMSEKLFNTSFVLVNDRDEKLNVKNLILWHTKDEFLENRQKKFL